jgi:ER membrane protein complex subunit 3
MMNPMAMLDMMKGNITFIVPNMAMMAIINQFFQGFVLVKVPFSLTNRFKDMLHRGIDLSTLDVSYVSSLSWYFLLMFGLRGLIKLFLGEDSEALDEGRAYQAQMGMGMVFMIPPCYLEYIYMYICNIMM